MSVASKCDLPWGGPMLVAGNLKKKKIELDISLLKYALP